MRKKGGGGSETDVEADTETVGGWGGAGGGGGGEEGTDTQRQTESCGKPEKGVGDIFNPAMIAQAWKPSKIEIS